MGTQNLKRVPMGTRVPKWGPTWEQCSSVTRSNLLGDPLRNPFGDPFADSFGHSSVDPSEDLFGPIQEPVKSRGEYFSKKSIFLHGPQKWPCTRIQGPPGPRSVIFLHEPQ